MTLSRPVALAIAGLGLALAVAGPLLPGGERLTRESPPEVGHVITLATAGDGSLLAGTQDGVLWRRAAGHWARLPVNLNAQPVTALAADRGADPARGPIGTAGGLVNSPPGLPPVGVRISDVVATRQGLVLGTGDGVRVQGDGLWRPAAPGINVYRLTPQTVADQDWLHLGSIGAGVLSARVENLSDWQPNRAGLHPDAKVFAFAVSAGGRLLAGTDHGLYWQPGPGTPWQVLTAGLEQARVLALLLDPPGTDGAQRLWIGTDAGLHRVALAENDAGVRVTTAAEALVGAADQVPHGIGWLLPDRDGVLFSAGAVYRYGPAGLAGWYWLSLLGVALVLVGGWLLPPAEAAA